MNKFDLRTIIRKHQIDEGLKSFNSAVDAFSVLIEVSPEAVRSWLLGEHYIGASAEAVIKSVG